jgi:hypothetical protein
MTFRLRSYGVARGRLETLRGATTLVMGHLWRGLPPMVLTGIVALRP